MPMRAPAIFAMLTLFLTSTTTTVAAEPPDEAEAQLLQLEEGWRAARLTGDAGYLERLYGRELRIVGVDGSVTERDDDIALFAQGVIKPDSIELDDLKVTVYDDAAVVTGLEQVKGRYQGSYSEFVMRFTDVFVRRDDRWQLVASQSTEVR